MVIEENDEMSRLEGSPSRSPAHSEKMSEAGGEEECRSQNVSSVVPCSLSSLHCPSPSRQGVSVDTSPEPLTEKTSEPTTTAENVSPQTELKDEELQQQQTETGTAPAPPLQPLKSPEADDVGREVEVFWPQENAWYCGVIDKFRDELGVVLRTMPSEKEEGSDDVKDTMADDQDVGTIKLPDEANTGVSSETLQKEEGTNENVSSAEDDVTPTGRASYHITYSDGDDEWIDGDDLVVLVFADMEASAKELRCVAVEEAMESQIKKKKPKKPRAPRKAKASQGSGASKGKGKGKAKTAASETPSKPLPPDVRLRVTVNEKKMTTVMDDLAATRCLVLAHHRHHYDDIVSSRKGQPMVDTTALETNSDVSGDQQQDSADNKDKDGDKKDISSDSAPLPSPMEFDEASTQYLVALAVQDSTKTLSSLVDSLLAELCPILTSKSSGTAVWHSKYCEAISLAEYIKTIATRSTYGYRSTAEIKQTSLFEDESPLALWRWEVLKIAEMATASPSAAMEIITESDEKDRSVMRLAFQTAEALKNIKFDYQRAGKVVKSVQRVIAELQKAAATSTMSAGAKAKAVMVGASTLDAASEVVIAGLEDRVTKSQAEVQKALDRKQQAEKKWEMSLDDRENKERKRKEEADRKALMKQKKQELQEAQQQLKLSKHAASEEAKAAKAALVALQSENKRKAKEDCEEEASKKKVKVLSEKEIKAQALLEKQKNMMSSFFKSAPAPKTPSVSTSSTTAVNGRVESPSTSSSSGTSPVTVDLKPDGSSDHNILVEPTVIDITTSNASTVAQPKVLPTRKPQRLTTAAALIQAAREKRPIDVEEFERSISPSTPFSMGEISRLYRDRYSGKPISKKKLRRPKKLSIMVTVEQTPVFVPGEGFRGPSAFEMAMGSGGSGQCSGGYSELKEVEVDSRKRLFSFSEDLRPPYYGTCSKKSLEVTGRRPFAKDMSNSIDYDVDSEAEWEEEEEGEDIIVSEDEDEGEGNDIVYDEFFCPDDEIVYADARGGDEPDPSGGKGNVDSVNAIFNAMQGQEGQGGSSRDMRSCIAGVSFYSPVASVDSASDTNYELLSRYTAVTDPCSYWSPLPEDRNVVTSAESLSPAEHAISQPPLVLTTPSLTAATQATERANGETSVHKKEKKEKVEKIDYRQFQEVLVPCLAACLHGRKGGVDKSVDAFMALWSAAESDDAVENIRVLPPATVPVPPSKAQIKAKIKEISKYVPCGNKVSRWIVNDEVLKQCPADVAESLQKFNFSNNVILFPVVSATEAIESMANVALPVVNSSTSSGGSNSTPVKGKENAKDKEKDSKGQASLFTYFSKPLSSPNGKIDSSTTPVASQEGVNIQDNEKKVEDTDSYEVAQKGISWWGESKHGDSPNTFKRKLDDQKCSEASVMVEEGCSQVHKKKKM